MGSCKPQLDVRSAEVRRRDPGLPSLASHLAATRAATRILHRRLRSGIGYSARSTCRKGKLPQTFGTDDPLLTEGYFKQLLYPFKPKDGAFPIAAPSRPSNQEHRKRPCRSPQRSSPRPHQSGRCALPAWRSSVIVLPSQLLTAPLPEGVALEDMTWTDVRNAVQAGYTTVIVPTGGLEQNGPHMVIGKHDYIVSEAATAHREGRRSHACRSRRRLRSGRRLCPADGPHALSWHDGRAGSRVRRRAWTASPEVSKPAASKTICFIGDHGQSQRVQAAVAQRLTAEWAKDGVRVVQIDAYYDDKAQIKRLLAEGRSLDEIGQHASIIDTSELLSVNPKGVDLSRYRSMTFSPRADRCFRRPAKRKRRTRRKPARDAHRCGGEPDQGSARHAVTLANSASSGDAIAAEEAFAAFDP